MGLKIFFIVGLLLNTIAYTLCKDEDGFPRILAGFNLGCALLMLFLLLKVGS